MFTNRNIERVFGHISVSRARTTKRNTLTDSVHRINVYTLSPDVLTVDEALCRWRLKNRNIGHVFGHISFSRARTSKRTPPSDSANRIGVSTLSKDVLTA